MSLRSVLRVAHASLRPLPLFSRANYSRQPMSPIEKPISANPAWRSLLQRLQALPNFRLHTGNINNYVELKIKRFANSAEELIACLDMQFADLDANIDVTGNNMLLLSNRGHNDTVYERDDLKTTLKIFLPDYDYEQLEAAVEAALYQLKTDNIEQLILAFPHSDNAQLNEQTDLDEEWFAKVLAVWEKVSVLVEAGKVLAVGVADFELPALTALYERATLKPCVDHYNIAGCCVVPPQLESFAKQFEIQLLTHNDPDPFPLKDIFRSFCDLHDGEAPICNVSFQPTWAARYTVWVRRRSLMASKGYIVQFVKE